MIKIMTEPTVTEQKEVNLAMPILNPTFKDNFEILEISKELENRTDLVVEDRNYGDILFLRRIIFKDDNLYEQSKEYFTVLEEFSQSNFSPMDMIKIAQVLTYNDEENSQNELCIFFEWGEPDCIDLERLTNAQTLKF